MKGDILIIKDFHRKAAKEIAELILPDIKSADKPFIITIAGESGAGKSEIAASLAESLKAQGIPSYVFQQDDFFIFPPKTNAAKRKEDIEWVGMQEVKLDLLNEIIAAIHSGVTEIEKPMVIFDEERITEETIDLSGVKVIIAEGTYTTALKNADLHIFIDRDVNDTRASRKERAREAQDEFLEQILNIEHKIISEHKNKAGILINKDFSVTKKY